MRKLTVVGSIALTMAVTMSFVACGKAENKDNVNETISVEIETTAEENSETQDNVKETEENTEKEQEEVDASSIGKVRTALSDSGVETNPDAMFSDIPSGVAPEFTYFMYDDVEGMVKAQQYLEKIGVSEEGKTIVLCQKQDFDGDSLRIFVISFEDGGTYRQDFCFESSSGSYEMMLEEMANSEKYCDEDARYIQTEKIEYPTANTYEEELQYYESMEELYTIAK